MDVKGNTAKLCCLLFENTTIRSTNGAARCVEPLVSLLASGSIPTQHSAVRALDKLIDDEKLVELVVAYDGIIPLVGLVCGMSYKLHEASSTVLVKLGKVRPSCKMDMVKAGVIEGTLDILHEAPRFFFAAFAELLEILTNDATIAKGSSAAKVVEPMLLLLTKLEIGPDSQRSALQVLVDILEHPQCRAECTLSSHQVIEPLIPLLDSQVPVVQQLSTHLLSHVLQEEHYLKNPISQQVIGPLLRVLGSGIPILQQKAIKALDNLVITWPHEIVKAGAIVELSKMILLVDPSLALKKSAIDVLSSILPFSSKISLEVPLVVLVKLLGSDSDATVISALTALRKHGSAGSISVVTMVESGVIEALLYLLSCHRCEKTVAELLKFVLTNHKIRETNIAERAILPLSNYLSDTQTQAQQAKLLVTIALGDLFQNETLTRSAHVGSACRAFVNLLRYQPSEDIKVVAISALKNLVRYGGSNTTIIAEVGGVQVLLDLMGSSDTSTSIHAGILMKLLFSTDVIQAYASSETVRAITSAIENNLRTTGTINDEYFKVLNALLTKYPELTTIDALTLSIPHFVTTLETGSETTQEVVLDALFMLSRAWSTCPADVSKSQSNIVANAIPLLQYLIKSGPTRFQEKAKHVLMCLPGILTVIIKNGNNMERSWVEYSYYCKLKLGNTPSKKTKASSGPDPKWNERFEWQFESPPIGQKLHISCIMMGKYFRFGRNLTWSRGEVTMPIDRVVMHGQEVGEHHLLFESESSGCSISSSLEIEFQWSVMPHGLLEDK